MPVNHALLSTAIALREHNIGGELSATRDLRLALAAYADACANAGSDEAETMSGFAIVVALATIGLTSGFSNGDPNPKAFKAAFAVIGEMTSEMLGDFVRHNRSSHENEVRH